MSLRILVIFICILDFVYNSNSQSDVNYIKISQGKNTYKYKFPSDKFEVIRNSPSGTIVLRSNELGKILELVDIAGNAVTSIELDKITHKGAKVYSDEVFIMSERLFVRSFCFNKEENAHYQLINEYDIANLAFVKEIRTAPFDGDKLKKGSRYGNDIRPGGTSIVDPRAIIVSRNNKYFVDYFYESSLNPKEHESILLTVYNNDFTELYSRKFEIPYHSNEFIFSSVCIDNNGATCVYGRNVSTAPYNSKAGKAKSNMNIFSFNPTNENVTKIIVSIYDFYTGESNLTINNEGKILVYGYYHRCNKSIYDESTEGCFTQIIDPISGEVVSTNTLEFSDDVILRSINENNRSKAEKNKEKGQDLNIENCKMTGYINYDSDRTIIIGEHWPTVTVRSDQHQDDRRNIIFEFNKSGEITKEYTFPIGDKLVSPGGYTMCDKNLVYFYEIPEKPGPIALSYKLIMSTMNEDGEPTSKVLKSYSQNEFRPRFISSRDIDECKILLTFVNMGRLDSEYSFGAITLK